MFPHTQYGPAGLTQGSIYKPVAGDVGGQLGLPKEAIVGGHVGVFGAGVPETRVAPTGKRLRIYESHPPSVPRVRRNYLEAEARNQSLGRAGEELALRFEHERLWRAGKKKLAERIEHVARTKGDYLGYDILSFEVNGQERLIEVKTTAFGAMTPFFASRNEVEFSESRDAEYQLYRLFNFRRQPKLFALGGAVSRSCRLEPIQYSATPR